MAPVPRPRPTRRRPRGLLRRPRVQGRPWRVGRRPALHLLVSVVPLPLVLLLTHGKGGLLLALLLAGLAVAGGVGLRRVQVRADRARRRDAALVDAEQTVELIWQDWLVEEAARGQKDLDRWRRSRKP